jgi:hypothetical protein
MDVLRCGEQDKMSMCVSGLRGLTVWACACALAGCAEPASKTQQCEQLRDHLVELRLDAARGLSEPARAQHRQALVASLGPDFVTTCADRTSEDELRCALAAATTQVASACKTGGAR